VPIVASLNIGTIEQSYGVGLFVTPKTKGLQGSSTITESVIGAAYRVANVLGAGFLEKVYESALVYELRRAGHKVGQQHPLEVRYEREIVGLFHADLVVDDVVIVELKAVPVLDRSHRAQCLNYLRATGLATGLVINFGTGRVDIQRVLAAGWRAGRYATSKSEDTDEHG